MIKTVHEWKPEIEPALKSKATELRLMGYDKTTSDDVWNCLIEKVWKGTPSKRVYEVVQDIFHLSSNIYMSYLTVTAYKDDDLAASIAALTENDQPDTI
ncbi:post-transcriptional regulator [Lentibacillus salinarum]|uniref:Post-transcriptional regulator n=1 Tax=Lentibacillus salinarum TaxID=446820 RepID=A0ABW3ZXP5_9BACI